MNIIFKVMFFSIMLNFSVGVMMAVVPTFHNIVYSSGLENIPGASTFTAANNGTINYANTINPQTTTIYRVLDFLNLGFLNNFIQSIRSYLFGFVDVLKAIFGPLMVTVDQNTGVIDTTLQDVVFGGLNGIILAAYTFGAWQIWTGKGLD